MSYKLAGVVWNDDGTISTKKPSPLEACKIIKEHNFPMMICTMPPIPATMNGETEKDLWEIIETALKKSEELKKCYKEELKNTSYYNNLALKQTEILRIIKETRVDTNIIKESKDYDDYCGLEAQKMLTLMFSAPKQIGITEEEYKLLKEVLL